MKAEDTVMSDEKILAVVGLISINYRKIACAQAEITWSLALKAAGEWLDNLCLHRKPWQLSLHRYECEKCRETLLRGEMPVEESHGWD